MTFELALNSVLDHYIKSWNSLDINEIINLYSCNSKLKSPFIPELFPENKCGIIEGKEDIINYYHAFMHSDFYEPLQKLQVERIGKEVQVITKFLNSNFKMLSHLTLNEYGKITKIECEYLIESNVHVVSGN